MGVLESRLERVHALAKGYVDRGALPGYACIVSSGDDVWFRAYGMRDVENALPVRRDTIFRIYSMTKPITSVALMMLYEEGRFQLDDPVARYIPSWKNLAVFEDGDEDSYSIRAPERPMIVKDLLMHTSGLTYGFMRSHSVDAIYRKRGIGGGDLQRMVDALAEIPLRFSPGPGGVTAMARMFAAISSSFFRTRTSMSSCVSVLPNRLKWWTPRSGSRRRSLSDSPRATSTWKTDASPGRTIRRPGHI